MDSVAQLTRQKRVYHLVSLDQGQSFEARSYDSDAEMGLSALDALHRSVSSVFSRVVTDFKLGGLQHR